MRALVVALFDAAFYIRWDNGSTEWQGLPLRLSNLLRGREGSRSPPVKHLAIGPNGSYFVLFEDGKYSWNNLDSSLDEYLELGLDVDCVALGQDEEDWVLVWCAGKRRACSGNLPKAFANAVKYNKRRIKYVSIGNNWTWVIGYTNGSWGYSLSDRETRRVEAISNMELCVLNADLFNSFCIIGDKVKAFAAGNVPMFKAIYSEYDYRALTSALRYTQTSISQVFQDGGSIQSLASDIKNRVVAVTDVPKIQVVRTDFRFDGDDEGIFWSLNNRRLWAFKAAGLLSVPVEMVSPTSEYHRKRQTKLIDGGRAIKLRAGFEDSPRVEYALGVYLESSDDSYDSDYD